MNMLKRGADRLNARRHETMTETVTYERGAQSVEIKATAMTPKPEETRPSDQHAIDERRLDWIVQVADLELGGSLVKPQTGDEIVHDDGTTARRYRVGPDGTEDAWRYTNAHAFAYRVHSTRIAEGASP